MQMMRKNRKNRCENAKNARKNAEIAYKNAENSAFLAKKGKEGEGRRG
jgi:hypothetical protein